MSLPILSADVLPSPVAAYHGWELVWETARESVCTSLPFRPPPGDGADGMQKKIDTHEICYYYFYTTLRQKALLLIYNTTEIYKFV